MSWTDRPERGSAVMVRIGCWLTFTFGWSAGHLLLYPITLYFFLCAREARASSADYLARILGRPPRLAERLRHFFCFASVTLDSLFFLGDRSDDFTIAKEGLDSLKLAMAEGRGCILLGSHLGSFDVLRAVGRRAPVRVRPVMFRQMPGAYTRLLESLDPDLAANVIQMGEPGAMLAVQQALAGGEIVSFLADRQPGAPERRRATVDFLDAPADFPTGPYAIAAALQVPVVLFFGLREGPRRYTIRFEPFADRIASSDRTALQAEAARYADRLAAHCRAAPFNWFNFYPFWKNPAA